MSVKEIHREYTFFKKTMPLAVIEGAAILLLSLLGTLLFSFTFTLSHSPNEVTIWMADAGLAKDIAPSSAALVFFALGLFSFTAAALIGIFLKNMLDGSRSSAYKLGIMHLLAVLAFFIVWALFGKGVGTPILAIVSALNAIIGLYLIKIYKS